MANHCDDVPDREPVVCIQNKFRGGGFYDSVANVKSKALSHQYVSSSTDRKAHLESPIIGQDLLPTCKFAESELANDQSVQVFDEVVLMLMSRLSSQLEYVNM